MEAKWARLSLAGFANEPQWRRISLSPPPPWAVVVMRILIITMIYIWLILSDVGESRVWFASKNLTPVKNGKFLVFGLQLENEERYRYGSNGWNDAHIKGNKCPVDKQWLRGRFDRVLPARSWEMPVKRELPAKIGRCSKNLAGRNFDFIAKSSSEKIFIYVKNFL